MDYKYQGIILKKKDVFETDRIYTIYTRETGKIRAMAKGVRKPNAKLAGQLEPVTNAEIFIAKSRGRGNITGTIAVGNFPKIKSSIDILRQVFYVFSIFDKIVDFSEKDEKLFDLLLGYLQTLEKKGEEKMDIITLGFVFKFLERLGYKIEAQKCVQCGKKLVLEKNYFNPELGGMLCENCAKNFQRKTTINSGAIKLIRIFSQNEIANFFKIKAEKKDMDNLKIVMNEMVGWIGG